MNREPVWISLFPVEYVLAQLPSSLQWMTAEELERQRSLRQNTRRDQFVAGHGLVRQMLAQVSGHPFHDWMLKKDAHGAPCLQVDGADTAWRATLAHAGEWVACAVAREALGIDIELADPPRNWLKLSKGMHPSVFTQALQQTTPERQPAHFLQRWTLDEAHGKATGRGLQRDVVRRQCWHPAADTTGEAVTWSFNEGCLALVLGGDKPRHIQWLNILPSFLDPPRYWQRVPDLP